MVNKGVFEISFTEIKDNGKWIDINKALVNKKFRDDFQLSFEHNMTSVLKLVEKIVTQYYRKFNIKVKCELKTK